MEAMPSDPGPQQEPDLAPASGPAGDLADVWGILDALPPARAHVDLAATTVDLVAAKVAGSARSGDRPPAGIRRWIIPVAAVVASLAGGLVVGRATAPDPDQWLLARLTMIEHLDLLQEAGSIRFLEAVAQRISGGPSQPRWFRPGPDPRWLREFDAALGKLEADAAARAQGRDLTKARRAVVAALPAVKQADLERDAETFRGLSSLDRRELMAVAAALADPANGRLRDAARAWHIFLTAMNPVVRRTVIDMPTEERLEMLERPAGRLRDEFRERRPTGVGGGPDGRPVPSGPPGTPPTGPARPRPSERFPEGRPGPPGLSLPPRPAANPREVPAETRAPQR